MAKFIPVQERCAGECGQRKIPGEQVCWSCYRRNAGRQGASAPMKLGAPIRETYVEPIPDPYPEDQQYRDLEELSRCESCGTTWGGHTLDCSEYLTFLDLTEEYSEADKAEQL